VGLLIIATCSFALGQGGAAAIERCHVDLSQPPYPAIPANEICGNLLLELNRSAEAGVRHGIQ
jgi:hypothetical protein